MSRRGNSARLYIGNLPYDIEEKELEDLFSKFGRIMEIDIKYGRTNNGTAYAFLEFADPRDADDAVEKRDGVKFSGTRLRVEFTGERRPKKSYNKSHGPPKRTPYGVIVTGLPESASWQDLKDHMRKAGPVGYANVEGRHGVVEYEMREDMEWAINNLDKTFFKNPFASGEIRVREGRSDRYYSSDGYDNYHRGRTRSRSGSISDTHAHGPPRNYRSSRPTGVSKHYSPHGRSRSRSPTRSRTRSYSKSRSRSPSERHSRSRSSERQSYKENTWEPSDPEDSRSYSNKSLSPRSGSAENEDVRLTNNVDEEIIEQAEMA